MNGKIMNDSRTIAVETATVRIRNKIILGEYQKGESLTETQMAEECAISRGSIRTALNKLESEGLIQSKPNGRKEVKGISQHYISDLYDMRLRLETMGIQTIMSQKGLTDLEYISGVVGGLGSPFSGKLPQDHELRASEDKYFHRALINASRNRVLASCWNVIEPVVWTLQAANAVYSRPENDYEDYVAGVHNQMIRLLLDRDPAIFDLLKVHICDAENATVKILKERGSI